MRLINAALNGRERYRGKAYFFNRRQYLRYDWGQDRSDYGPASLQAWELPIDFARGFDTALNGQGSYESRILFFKENRYADLAWESNEGRIDTYPISDFNFPGEFANGIDAALNGEHQHAGKALLFKGSQYIRFDWQFVEVDLGPLPLSDWNLPLEFAGGIDAALNGEGRFAGKAYFFKGDQYVRYDWKTNRVDAGPRPIVNYWRGVDALRQPEPEATVTVKLRDEVAVPYQDGVEQFFLNLIGAAWHNLLLVFPFITLLRCFTSLTPGEIKAILDEAQALSGEAPPNLLAYYLVRCPPAQAQQVAEALAQLPEVEYAYVRREVSLASVNPADDPESKYQDYLRGAPLGINAHYAWDIPGGDGKGVRFIDVDAGWNLAHEDLRGAGVRVIGKPELPQERVIFEDHGTSVLGVVLAQDNKLGCVGITPRVTAAVAPCNMLMFIIYGIFVTIEDALLRAFWFNSPGVPLVVLIGLRIGDDKDDRPIESDPLYHEAIKLLIAANFTVIEIAGNSGKMRVDPTYEAIIVGAGNSGKIPGEAVRQRSSNSKWGSNYGERVDCFAQGDGVRTTGSSTNSRDSSMEYQEDFNGTSAASAIVAGAAIAVHGMYKAANPTLPPLTHKDIRDLLGSTELNTQSAHPKRKVGDPPINPGDPPPDLIGVMPDLRRIAHSLGLYRPIRAGTVKLDSQTLYLVGINDEDDFFSQSRAVGKAGKKWSEPLPNIDIDIIPAARRPAIVCRTTENTDAFFVGIHGQLYTSYWTKARDAWALPFPISGGRLAPTASLTALARGANNLDVFGIGNDGRLYWTCWPHDPSPDRWLPLTPIGGAVRLATDSGLVALNLGGDTILIFGVRADGALCRTFWNNVLDGKHWNTSRKLGSIGSSIKLSTESVLAALVTQNHIHVFGISTTGELQMTRADVQTAPNAMTWGKLIPIGGRRLLATDGAVAAVARNPLTVDVFVIGADGLLYNTWWTEGKAVGDYVQLRQIGGTTEKLLARGGVSAVALNENDVHVIVCNKKGQLLTTRWQGGDWSPLQPLI